MEPIDVYSDNFMVTTGPYGANLTFGVTPPHPDPASPKAPERVAVIRMSVEHMKVMAFVLMRSVKQMEGGLGVNYQVPSQVLAQLGIAREDWDSFWSRK